MEKTLNGLYTICEWISKGAWLNLIWLGYLIAGLGLTAVPTVIAAFTVIRKWLRGEADLKIWRTFHTAFITACIKSWKPMVLFTGILILLMTQVAFFVISGGAHPVQLAATVLFITLIGGVALYLFPVWVHYELSFIQMVKQAALIAIISPLHTLLMAFSAAALVLLFAAMPALFPFFGLVTFAVAFMVPAYHRFIQISRKKEALQTGMVS
ncbi:YesL family protein [Jeotgalibacillus malaysiensis]|uniref:YesL family protein n=1 Tax=Jeotgalibacillus malaysiensis TaxID=1508404 RepID=UPI00384FAC99